jgi:hypothetical protein
VDDFVPVDPNFGLMFEELQHMEARLGEKIEGRCGGGLDTRVLEVEQKAEERYISLELFRTESEMGRATLESQFRDLKLEVNRLNRFMEHENLGDPQGSLASSPTRSMFFLSRFRVRR